MAASIVMDPTSSRRSSVAPPSRPLPRSRTQSLSSDRPSTIMSPGLTSPPLSVSPEAAFIAASAASQIVTNDHDSHANTWYDEHAVEPASDTAMVSPAALQLVNNFLDQLLFNFLNVSRGTSLSSLRPAVTEVLKPKLAKDAINNADEELREYLGGGDEDDFEGPKGAASPAGWDLELVWKRTRLRCMVYSSLGDMEEEDEDFYTEQESLEPGVEEQGLEVVSPAVAIFLTSILEFMGEAALVVAGQAAYHRMQTQLEKELKEGAKTPGIVADRIVVEELDMERVALDRTLGRLWRAWKKRIRSPASDGLRPLSRASFGHLRKTSSASELLRWTKKAGEEGGEPEDGTAQLNDPKAAEEETVEEYLRASRVPLPLDDRDIEEIEVPGLVSYSDSEDDGEDVAEPTLSRPKSLAILSGPIFTALPTPPLSPIKPSSRKRSSSLPNVFASAVRREAKRPKIDADVVDEAQPGHVEIEKVVEAAETAGSDANQQRTAEEMPKIEEVHEDPPEIKPRSSKRNSKRASQLLISSAALGTPTVISTAPESTSDREHLAQEEQPAKPEIEKATGAATGDDAGEIEDFDEEPQIMTSARVSITGRSSPAVSEAGRPPSINTNIPQRTPSVHSVRVIDVLSPKSPVAGSSSNRSRTPSEERAERIRAASHSRASSGFHTPPIAEEGKSETDTTEPLARSVRTSTARSPVDKSVHKTIAEQPVSQVQDGAASVPIQNRPARTSSMPRDRAIAPIRTELTEELSEDDIDLPIFGSAVRQPGSPRMGQSQSTKVTILGSTTSAGQFVAPTTPGRSPVTRQDGFTKRSSSRSPDQSQSIGMVSVERQSPGRESGERRHLHTSGSSTSSAAGRLRPLRSSEDSKGSSRANDHVTRNFEELIQSDETIQYTLTPENMRDVKPGRSPQSSPVVGSKSRRSDEVRDGSDRSHSTSSTAANRTSSVSRTTGLSSHPVSQPKGYVPRAPPNASPSTSRTGGPQARDARVARESVLDFADFIRSTGPTAENGPAPIRNTSGQPAYSGLDSRRSGISSSRSRLQAREAAVDNREDNSDLIDFIRRGPQSSANPRIPRHVAPFRTTMDSDQMSGAVGGRAVDASLPDIRYSQASTNVTDVTMPSVQSSTNSQSALLKSSRQNQIIDEEDMVPKRTRRRVKDPYAIDFSDEEDDDLFAEAPKPPPNKEESLAEFLKNYEPPPEPPAQAIPHNKPKKKLSAPSLIGRFSRSLGSSHSQQAPSFSGKTSASQSGADSIGGNRGHIPIQVNGPGAVGPSTRPATQTRSINGRVPMKKFEPREPVSQTSRTDDLASFLRDSEPPPGMTSTAVAYSPREEESSRSFSKVFSRRKRSAVA